jgi:hypothetical protein
MGCAKGALSDARRMWDQNGDWHVDLCKRKLLFEELPGGDDRRNQQSSIAVK